MATVHLKILTPSQVTVKPSTGEACKLLSSIWRALIAELLLEEDDDDAACEI